MANRDFVFFYAPTWDYPPNGPIKLGNVITSVKTPHRPLACISPPEEASGQVSSDSSTADDTIYRTKKSQVSYTKEKLRSGKFSILTKFLSILGFGVDVGAEIDNSDEEEFVFDSVETSQFIPSPAYIQTSVEATTVRRFLENSRYRKAIYIITGVKVVNRANANTSKARGLGGNLAVEVDGTLLSGGTVPVGGGPEIEAKRTKKAGTSWEGSSDFVFAFRVSKVFVGKSGQVDSEEDYRKGAMLGDDVKVVKGPALTVLKVEEADAELEGYDAEELMDDEQMVHCAIPRAEESDS